MTDKPTIAAGYGGGQTELVRATCLYVATKLGDIIDELVVVGGLVPSLLVKQEDLSCCSPRVFQLRKNVESGPPGAQICRICICKVKLA